MADYSLIGEFVLGPRADQAERLAEVRLQHLILTHRDERSGEPTQKYEAARSLA